MRVAVVGGGVVGLAVAWDLRRAGADVVLLERETCGGATSAGNAGWICPSFAAPLAAPGAVVQGLRWLTSSRSPFAIRLRPDPALVRWLWLFQRAARPNRYEVGLAALARFTSHARADFEDVVTGGVHVDVESPGVLLLARSRDALSGYARTLDELVDLGYGGTVEELTGNEARAREPAIGEGVTHAIYASMEQYVRPEELCRQLKTALAAAGGDVREHTAVAALRRTPDGWLVADGQDGVRADVVVIAAGVWSKGVLGGLGVDMPLEGAKGYSITADVESDPGRYTLYFSEAKVAYTPFGRTVRLAGTLELGARDLRLRRPRLEAVRASASDYLAEWKPRDSGREWAGLRPLAPDGLPLIGAVPGRPGLFLATGHGMLGVTLAPATAFALRRLIVDGETVDEVRPFDPARFMHRPRPKSHATAILAAVDSDS